MSDYRMAFADDLVPGQWLAAHRQPPPPVGGMLVYGQPGPPVRVWLLITDIRRFGHVVTVVYVDPDGDGGSVSQPEWEPFKVAVVDNPNTLPADITAAQFEKETPDDGR